MHFLNLEIAQQDLQNLYPECRAYWDHDQMLLKEIAAGFYSEQLNGKKSHDFITRSIC